MIASGGAGGLDDFVDVFTAGAADAALAASIFHYAETSVRALKQHLRAHGIPVDSTVTARSHMRIRHVRFGLVLVTRPLMLIPAIDLKDGAVVQLVQGERLAIRDEDVFEVGEAVRALSQGAGDRSRCGDGHGRQPRHRPPDRGVADVPRRRRHSHRRARAGHPGRRRAGRSSPARRSSRTARPTSTSPQRLADAVGAEQRHRGRRQPRAARSSFTAGRRRCRSRRSKPSGRSSPTAASFSTPTSTPKG